MVLCFMYIVVIYFGMEVYCKKEVGRRFLNGTSPYFFIKLRRSQGFFTLASSVLLWWTQRDLNPRPLRCERSALPAELWALKDYVIIILLCRHFCNSFLHFFVVRLKKWCGRRDLNPHDCSPDPKSGASANSATSAD